MRAYKLSLIAALALGSLLVCNNMGYAQDTKEGKKKGGPSVEQRVDQLSTELNLTADQKTKVTAIMQEEATKSRELRSDTSLSREQRAEKRRAIMQETSTKVKAVLTPDQRTKYDKILEQRKERMREKKGETKSEKKTD